MRFALLALLVGCGVSSTVEITAEPPRPLYSRRADEIDVLDALPTRAHIAIAQIHSGRTNRPGFNSLPRAEAIAELRRAAAQLGCDAVAVIGEEYSKGHKREGVVGTCIVFADEPPRSSQALGPR
jgi:hypothetical protein